MTKVLIVVRKNPGVPAPGFSIPFWQGLSSYTVEFAKKSFLAIMKLAKKRYDVSCRHKRTPSSSHYWGFFSFWTVELPLG